MDDVKRQISEWLKITTGNLNEISLEDIQFEPVMQESINNAVIELFSISQQIKQPGCPDLHTYSGEGNPFQGFWLEKSKDLVVYTWIGNQLKAIVVPKGCWGVREDITRN